MIVERTWLLAIIAVQIGREKLTAKGKRYASG
jgi:hypothetical protein